MCTVNIIYVVIIWYYCLLWYNIHSVGKSSAIIQIAAILTYVRSCIHFTV